MVALYPQQTVTFVREQIERFAPGSILVDLCGVKRYPVENLTSLCAGHGVTPPVDSLQRIRFQYSKLYSKKIVAI